LYVAEPDGQLLDNIYKLAWIRGLKTTYYLRSMGASAMAKNNKSSQQETPAVNTSSMSVNLQANHVSVVSLSHIKPELVEACGDGGCS
jgi:ribonucleoside-diphosphate reductase alpha chain